MAKRRSLSFAILGILSLALLGSAPSRAATPSTINIHGQLLNAAGQPLAGDRAWQVRFFDAQTGGTQLGSTLTGTVTVSAQGVFDIPVAPPQQVLLSAQPWYELAVDGTPTPNGVDNDDVFPQRVAINSVPFALEAGHIALSGVGAGTVSDTEFSALDGITGGIQSQLNLKANAADVYTKTAADTAIAAKANKADVYTKTEADGKQFSWTAVSGGDVQAAANHGYIVTDTARRSVVLPASDSVAVGDIIRITGAGAGGWRLAQNSAQQVLTGSLQIQNTSKDWLKYADTSTWRFIAASSDGRRLAACASSGQINLSTDCGATWTPCGPSGLDWRCIASSADGQKLVAGAYGGKLYTSADSGATWTARGAENYWMHLACSDDGAIVYASTNGDKMYVSTDSGATWTQHGYTDPDPYAWTSVAASSDGTKAVSVGGGHVLFSADSGNTWTASGTAPYRGWEPLAASGDLTKIVAGVWEGSLFTSTDSGATWTETGITNKWVDIACSSDGTKFIAVAYPGQAYMSTDSGITWKACAGNTNWFGVTASGDFSVLAATAESDGIYRYTATMTQSTPGTAGALSGGANTAVELQYIGGGTFMPISHEGTLAAN